MSLLRGKDYLYFYFGGSEGMSRVVEGIGAVAKESGEKIPARRTEENISRKGPAALDQKINFCQK